MKPRSEVVAELLSPIQRRAGEGDLKEHQDQAECGAAEYCRKYGISDAAFYIWRSKYGGLGVSEAHRLRSLEAEKAKLKRLLGDATLDVSTLKKMLTKLMTLRSRREAVDWVMQERGH